MIHLHCHTSKGSFLDSTVRPEELPLKAKELGMKSVSITEHGYTCSIVDFYKACRKEGIKPILGCELYVCDDIKNKDTDNRYDHLIILAKNKTGYKNMLKLSSLGFTEGFYYKPRVDISTLNKYKEGLIITTACAGGEIPRAILNKVPYWKIKETVEKYAIMFEDFYLEVQSADNNEQKLINQTLVMLSKETGVPIVATSDVHFLNKDDLKLHGIFIQINQERDNEVYQDCWFKTEEEVLEILLKHIGFEDALSAIANTHVISDMCNVELQLNKSYLPDYPVPEPFQSEDEYLWQLVREGYKERGFHKFPKDMQQKYQDRLRYEYDIIKQKGFSGYFLHVRNIIKKCEMNNILTGDGRGSADNSQVCYTVGITNVDSIKYDLNFSRFLTLGRKALPDVDMDIQASQKQRLVNMLKDEYGHDRVAQICTFTTLQAKACIDAIGKVVGVPYKITTEIKKHIPDQTSLKEALKNNSKLLEYNEKYPELFDYVVKLEGLPRGISVHAGGVVLCPSSMEMSDFTAISLSKDKEEITQLEMHNVEEVGLVKMDILGIVTLDIIADTLTMLGKDKSYIDVSTLDFDNRKTYEMIQKGLTDGVFQLESSGMKDTCIRVKPENMEDIIAILALYRPDTMRELEHYINRKHGREEVVYLHPDLKPILHKTFGAMIYQEQLMEITRVFANFDDEEADTFRKGIGKKDPILVQDQAEKFRVRAIKNNYLGNVVNKLADILKKMGGYLFNKGHASGYGISTYKTGFLKANHPVEYMCSLMTNQRKQSGATDYESIGLYTVKCQEMGIEVKNPDINLSEPQFTPHNNAILFGFNLIKGVGQNAVDLIMEHRPFNSFEDFIERIGGEGAINKNVTIALIKSGCFDFTGVSRKGLLKIYGNMRFLSGADKYKPLTNINKTHIAELLKSKIIKESESGDKECCLKAMNKWRKILHEKEWADEVMEGDEYSWEFQTLSYHIIGDPFKGCKLPSWDRYEEDFEQAKFFGTVVSIKKTKIKRGNQKGKTMAFLEFSTPEGIREGVAFADSWLNLQDRLDKGNMVVVRGKKQGEKCIINGALDFVTWKEKENIQ